MWYVNNNVMEIDILEFAKTFKEKVRYETRSLPVDFTLDLISLLDTIFE